MTAPSIEALEQRIASLELGAQYDATQTVIRQREEEMLATLRDIRSKMAEEQTKENSSVKASEVKTLQDENERLKGVIAKQEYRIRHLIQGFEEYMAQKGK